MVPFPCPSCGRRLSASDEAAGGAGTCSFCGSPVQIPSRDYIPEALPVPGADAVQDVIPVTDDDFIPPSITAAIPTAVADKPFTPGGFLGGVGFGILGGLLGGLAGGVTVGAFVGASYAVVQIPRCGFVEMAIAALALGFLVALLSLLMGAIGGAVSGGLTRLFRPKWVGITGGIVQVLVFWAILQAQALASMLYVRCLAVLPVSPLAPGWQGR